MQSNYVPLSPQVPAFRRITLHNTSLNIIMISRAIDQNAKVMCIRSNKDAMEDFVLIAVHQIDVILDEIIVIERIMNEAFEDVLINDNDLFDDEVVLWDELG